MKRTKPSRKPRDSFGQERQNCAKRCTDGTKCEPRNFVQKTTPIFSAVRTQIFADSKYSTTYFTHFRKLRVYFIFLINGCQLMNSISTIKLKLILLNRLIKRL
jgi:hypothetical protein